MSFDHILTSLESGKISVEQAKEHIKELIEDTKTCSTFTGIHGEIWKSGVNCVMIRFGMRRALS